MVPVLEVAFLIVLAVFGAWWFLHTKVFRYRSHGGSAADPSYKHIPQPPHI